MRKNKLLQSVATELAKIRAPQNRIPLEADVTAIVTELSAGVDKNQPIKDITDVLNEATFFELTSARSQLLITKEQQQVLRNTVVGFFGLSVGSHAALTWMMESRAKSCKISDPDVIDVSNLNRLRVGIDSIGRKKIDIFSQALLTINPFAHVITNDQIDYESVRQQFTGDSPIQVVVDAIDNLQGKIWLRQLAKEFSLPLISATDVGDNVFLDIERYDLLPQPDFFLGRVPGIENLSLDALTPIERIRLSMKIVGLEHNSESMLQSLLNIGVTIPTWPQLGATATIAGGITCTAIKKIVLGEKVLSDRYIFSLDSMLDSSFGESTRERNRDQLKVEIMTRFGG